MKRLVRTLLKPFVKLARMFFDPRFGAVQEELAKQNHVLHDLREASEAALDFDRLASTVTGREIALTRSGIDSLDGRLSLMQDAMTSLGGFFDWYRIDDLQAHADRIQVRLDEIADLLRVQTTDGNPNHVGATLVEHLTTSQASFLNFAGSHLGFAAQRNLWFNDPVSCVYRAGDVAVSTTTERILEVPFALAAASKLAEGARILDVGCAESLLALQLASSGFQVTGIDLRKYPLAHRNLEIVVGMVEEWSGPSEPFDAIVCLSSIEHFGLGAYGEDAGDALADQKAMTLLRGWTKPAGVLILTVPFGAATDTPTMRVYDTQRLEELLKGWAVKDIRYGQRTSPTTWEVTSRPPIDTEPGAGVVMLTASPD